MKIVINFILISIFFMSFSAHAEVIDLKTPDQVKKEFAKGGPMVVMYYTDWCGVCHETLPKFKKASEIMTNVKFYTMNADKIGLKEHQGKIPYIPRFFFGKTETELRNSPCGIDDSPRTSAAIKLMILNCMGVK